MRERLLAPQALANDDVDDDASEENVVGVIRPVEISYQA
jgi:hypothetical protein